MGFEHCCRFRKEASGPSRAFPSRKSIIRPYARLTVINGDRHVDVLALIDSGADNCLFDADFGRALGLDVERGYPEKTIGVGGIPTDVFFHDVKLEIDGTSWSARVGFMHDLKVGALAGREGFFSKFKVSIDQSRALTVLTA